MVDRKGGLRRKSRHKFSKNYRQKGKISTTAFFKQLAEGEQVKLLAEPAYQKGMYRARFHGRQGVVQGKQGDCYRVAVPDGGKEKMLHVHPVHLKKL